ncbi:MAG: glycosyltransferase [Deltaproteobacteria bacterium]|nr:glycosyltransferase [Deltaproteobacteria bacterium]
MSVEVYTLEPLETNEESSPISGSALKRPTEGESAAPTPSGRRTRRSLLSTPLWGVPFQLLPHKVYPATDLERLLVWQSDFAAALPERPEFLVATFVDSHSLPSLWALVASVATQSYPDVECCIGIASESMRGEATSLLQDYGVPGEVVLVSTAEEKERFTRSLGSRIRESGGYAVILNARSLLHPTALFVLAKQLMRRLPDLVYTNEVIVTENLLGVTGFVRRSPIDKYSLLSMNGVGEMVALSQRAAAHLPRICDRILSGEGFDFWALAAELLPNELRRAFVPLGLLHSRAELPDQRIENPERALALQDYARNLGIPLYGLEFQNHELSTVAHPRLAEQHGSVQVVIPYRGQSEVTLKCLQSLAAQDCASSLHVTLVDNGSDPEERSAIERFLAIAPFQHISHPVDPRPFNFAQLNNLGAAEGTEDFILFLNNDVELTSRDAISVLRSWGAMDDIGAVGGHLRYPSGATQHAGISFLSVGPANISQEHQFPFVTREVNAVTFALALVKRKAFQAVNGLDEFTCPNGFGDALFCLELRKRGYRSLYTPHVEGTHHEGHTRGELPEQLEYLEMTQQGIPITDLYPDFYAELQPMFVRMGGGDASAFTKLVGRIQRSPRLLGWANGVAKFLLALHRLVRG